MSEGKIVELTYSFNALSTSTNNRNFYVCIDIPKKLELVEFRMNGNIIDSGVSSLDKNYNRVYLPVRYKGEKVTIAYKVKATPDFKPNSKLFISHALRDASGNHVNVPWMKAYLIYPPLVEDGSNDDDYLVKPKPEVPNEDNEDIKPEVPNEDNDNPNPPIELG